MTPQYASVLLEQVMLEMRRTIVGQQRLLERLVVGLVAGGHCLLESVPGLAKTLAAETLARCMGGTFARVQFTPDLLPSDIVGTRIYRPSGETFHVELGPVFVNLLLADEVNRAPAKVQSALLEVMAERQVSLGGTTYPVPAPFFVIATQNPLESEGVYQLPDAQRDRFMMKVVMTHPSAAEELAIVERMSVSAPPVRQVLDVEQLLEVQQRCRCRARRPQRGPVRRGSGAGHPASGQLRPTGSGQRDRVGGQSPRHVGAGPWCSGLGAHEGSRSHHHPRRVRSGARSVAASSVAHLRRCCS
jgi:MoxR-like ATPase